MGISSVAKKIILEELQENIHPEKVEDVIFWALEAYSKDNKNILLGKTVAKYIVDRIKEDEDDFQAKNN